MAKFLRLTNAFKLKNIITQKKDFSKNIIKTLSFHVENLPNRLFLIKKSSSSYKTNVLDALLLAISFKLNKHTHAKAAVLSLVTFLFYFADMQHAQGQCATAVNTPTTINGINVTGAGTGSISVNPTAFTSCGLYTTPPNSLWLGQSGSFSYTYTFSTPVNDLTFVLTDTGSGGNENFIFTTNASGSPTITDEGSCYSTITAAGNEILSGFGSDSFGGGGIFVISNTVAFTALTISGNGGLAGSLFALCPSSVVNATCGDAVITSLNLSQDCAAGESIQINIDVQNNGDADIAANMPISIYNGDPTVDGTLLVTDTTLGLVAISATVSHQIILAIDPTTITGDIYVTLNDDGSDTVPITLPVPVTTTFLECDYTNNISNLANTLSVCPEICNNDIDDDFDGALDSFDTDCSCDPSSSGGLYAACSSDCEIPFTLSGFATQLTANIAGIHNYGQTLIGDLDADGNPDIITSHQTSALRMVYDGVTKAFKFSITNPNGGTNRFAIGDVLDDSRMEIFQLEGTFITCRDITNVVLWSTAIIGGSVPQLADFNHDGIAELYVGNTIMNAQTGIVLAQGIGHTGGTSGIAADVFKGENLELVAGHTVYSVNITNTAGTTGNTITAVDSGLGADGTTYVADFDLDGELDVLTQSGATIIIWNPRTNTLMSSVAGTGNGSTVVLIGNMDDDDYPEIAKLISGSLFRAFDYDGVGLTTKWTIGVADGSAATGATMFDFNADGQQEILYRDEVFLRVINASNGSNITTISVPSWTNVEYPIVADIDNDNEAEIVVVSGSVGTSIGTLRVYESNGSPWAPARPIWNQWKYRAVAVNDNGTIPQYEVNAAISYTVGADTYRPYNSSQVQLADTTREGLHIGFSVPDATITALTVLNNDCTTGTASIRVDIDNIGAADLPAATPIAIYNGDPEVAGATLITTDTIGTLVLEGGTTSRTINLTGITSPTSLFVVINDDGTAILPYSIATDFPITTGFNECDYTNNKSAAPTILCSFDLAITNIVLSQNCSASEPIIMDITISNTGDNTTQADIQYAIYGQDPLTEITVPLAVDTIDTEILSGDTLTLNKVLLNNPLLYPILYVVVNDDGTQPTPMI